MGFSTGLWRTGERRIHVKNCCKEWFHSFSKRKLLQIDTLKQSVRSAFFSSVVQFVGRTATFRYRTDGPSWENRRYSKNGWFRQINAVTCWWPLWVRIAVGRTIAGSTSKNWASTSKLTCTVDAVPPWKKSKLFGFKIITLLDLNRNF